MAVFLEGAAVVWPFSHGAKDLGRQDHVAALAVFLEGAADDLLTFALVVYVGGVDEVDASVQGTIDDFY